MLSGCIAITVPVITFHTTMKHIPILLLLSIMFVSMAHAQDAEVRVNTDKNADFSQYKTFYWSAAVSGNAANSQVKSFDAATIDQLKQTIIRKMEAMGYTLQENNPDLLVNFYTLTKDTSNTAEKPEFPDLGYSFWWGPDWYDRGDDWKGWNFWVDGSNYFYYGQPDFQADASAEASIKDVQPGTLFIDLIDKEKKRLVWEGYIPGQSSQALQQDVEALLQELPTGKDQG